MKQKTARITAILLAATFAAGITAYFFSSVFPSGGAPSRHSGARWYSPETAAAGAKIYAANCMLCHGAKGAGDANWRRAGADGKFPPPPLNGTAHTWHHPLAALRRTIEQGGVSLGGAMPAFGGKLNAQERDAAIAYIQSLWSEKIYQEWERRGGRNR